MNFDDYQREGQTAYARLAETVARIVAVVLKGVPDLRVQQIQSRAKSIKSLGSKLSDRGVGEDDDIEAAVKDLAGCRIVCYTNSDVARLVSSQIIGDNFEVDWDRTKFHYPPSEATAASLFISYNYVLKLREERVVLPEYAEFRDMWCEVQIQTTLDHAWSEMAHDTIYKRPLPGFGSALMKDVEARMTRIMEKYLRPAGFDFQKVANDVDRLRRGRALFENDPIRTLNACRDNNERYHSLSEFKDHVLPYYDDLGSMSPEIRGCMIAVNLAARTAPVVPTQYGFGFTRQHILESTLEVIDRLRFTHEGAVEATLDALLELWVGAETSDETDRLIRSARGLAANNLSVWQQVGPLVQQILVEKVRQLSPQVKTNRPLIVAVLDEVLKFDVGGATWNFGSVTIHRGSVLPSDALRRIRRNAIEVLQMLFRGAEDDTDRRTIKHAFNDAARPPSGPNVDSGLLEIMLQDALVIVDFYLGIAGGLGFELLQSLERDLYWLYRHQGKPRADLQDAPKIVELRHRLAGEIIAFRDQINSDRRFVIYKTLVGFESVFPPMWDNEIDIEEEDDYRRNRIREFVECVSLENAHEWFEIIGQCTRTKSEDGATFITFAKFLEELASERPDFALQLVTNIDADLVRFLPSILRGLATSERQEEVRPLADKWLIESMYLLQIVIYCGVAPTFDATLLERALNAAIEKGDEVAVIRAMEVAARQDAASDELIERVFLPGLRYLASIRDTRWVQAVWPFARKSAVFSSLNEVGVDEVLASLMREEKLGHESEWVMAVIAKNWPIKVVDYFIGRLRFANSNEASNDFEPVPFSFSELRKPLASVVADIVQKLRAWHDEDDRSFQYRGARLLKALFPNFVALETSLRTIVAKGERGDIEFVLAVLMAFDGQKDLQPICRDIVAALQPDGDLLNEVAVVLDSTGVVSGPFGFVEAYQRKKAEIEDWLSDPRELVRAFAEKHIRSLERQIAADQRRSMEEHELRKRQYEDLAEADDAAEATKQ